MHAPDLTADHQLDDMLYCVPQDMCCMPATVGGSDETKSIAAFVSFRVVCLMVDEQCNDEYRTYVRMFRSLPT